MIYSNVRSDPEVDAQLNAAAESEDSGVSRWPGMTFEQGVRRGIDWVLGNTDDPPIEDD
jgi:hypothetical protein